MAKLPDRDYFGGRPTPRARRPIATFRVPDLEAGPRGEIEAAQGIEQAGRGLMRLGAQGFSKAMESLAEQERVETARARSSFLTAKVEADSAFDDDSDYATYDDRYKERMDKAAEDAAGMIQSPRGRELFELSVKDDVARGRAQIQQLARRRETDTGLASLESTLASNMTAALGARDKPTRVEIMDSTAAEINAAVSKGWLDEVAGGRLKRQFARDYADRYSDTLPDKQVVRDMQPYVDNPEARTGSYADFLDQDIRMAKYRQAERVVKVEREREVRVARNQLRLVVDDHLASLRATGVGVQGVRDRAAALLPEDDFKLFVAEERRAVAFHDAAETMQSMRPAEMVEAVESFRPAPGSSDFLDRQGEYEEIRRAAVNIMQQRDRDAAAYVQRTTPDVQRAFARAEQQPERLESAIGLSLGEQEEIGVPRGSQRALPKPMANAIVQDIEQTPPAERGAKMLGIQAQSGRHFTKLLQELNEEGLDPGSQVLTLIAADPVTSERVAGFLAVGDKELAQGLDTTAVRDLRQTIRDELADWSRAVQFADPTAGRAAQVNDIMTAVETAAIGVYRESGDMGAAADFAVALIRDRYTVQDTYYAPNELGGVPIDLGKVETAIGAALQPAAVAAFSPVTGTADPGLAGEPELLQEQWNRTVVNSAVPVTRADGTGVDFVVPAYGGGFIPVVDAGGNPYGVDFIEASQRSYGEILPGAPEEAVERLEEIGVGPSGRRPSPGFSITPEEARERLQQQGGGQ